MDVSNRFAINSSSAFADPTDWYHCAPSCLQVYRLFCRRLSILASNMRLTGLSAAIANASVEADNILADVSAARDLPETAIDVNTGDMNDISSELSVSPSHPHRPGSTPRPPSVASTRSLTKKAGSAQARNRGDGSGTGVSTGTRNDQRFVKEEGRAAMVDVVVAKADDVALGVPAGTDRTWAYARAALVLRTEAVAIALQWITGAEKIQVRYNANTMQCRPAIGRW